MSNAPLGNPNPYAQQQPAQPPYPASAPVAAQAPMNTMAIVGFVASFVISIVGLVLSILALVQIKRTGERGRGFALAGIILSAVSIVLAILLIVLSIALAASGVSTGYAGS